MFQPPSGPRLSIPMAALLLLTLGHAPARVNDPPPERPPNIVLFLSDDQGYADVGCQQHEEQIATPHIDRLADEGVRFTSGYASAYVCAPTRAGARGAALPSPSMSPRRYVSHTPHMYI